MYLNYMLKKAATNEFTQGLFDDDTVLFNLDSVPAEKRCDFMEKFIAKVFTQDIVLANKVPVSYFRNFKNMVMLPVIKEYYPKGLPAKFFGDNSTKRNNFAKFLDV